jgi:hypothetical protein
VGPWGTQCPRATLTQLRRSALRMQLLRHLRRQTRPSKTTQQNPQQVASFPSDFCVPTSLAFWTSQIVPKKNRKEVLQRSSDVLNPGIMTFYHVLLKAWSTWISHMNSSRMDDLPGLHPLRSSFSFEAVGGALGALGALAAGLRRTPGEVHRG